MKEEDARRLAEIREKLVGLHERVNIDERFLLAIIDQQAAEIERLAALVTDRDQQLDNEAAIRRQLAGDEIERLKADVEEWRLTNT